MKRTAKLLFYICAFFVVSLFIGPILALGLLIGVFIYNYFDNLDKKDENKS